jgi:hypothetical protein
MRSGRLSKPGAPVTPRGSRFGLRSKPNLVAMTMFPPLIRDDAALWRIIHPTWIVQDDNERGWRISSAAFDDSKDGSPLSVLLAEVVAGTGRTADDLAARFAGYGLAAITAGAARAQR